jgi:adenosylcobinamide-GDP ribazoletransferase
MLIALQFLTVLPIRVKEIPAGEALGRSLLFYPLVGFLMGLLLAGLAWVLADASGLARAAILLVFWVLLSGGLHLDGLADCADAWVGGLGDRERTLAIMKDPRAGPAAVVTVVVLLLLKFAAIDDLVSTGHSLVLVAPPLLGRCAALGLFVTTAYVRPGGLGEALARHVPQRAGQLVVLCTLAGVFLAGGPWPVAVGVVLFLGLRAMMRRRIGGFTGDAAGALIELTEAVTLAALALTV